MEIKNIQHSNQSTEQLEQRQYMKVAQKQEIIKVDIEKKLELNPGYVPSISEKAIIQAIEEANKKIAGPNKTFEVSIHEKTKEIMIKVLNSDTKEIIREIPSEKILDMVACMCEAAGLFVDEKR